MASATDTAKPEPGRRWWARPPASRLGRLILALNLLGLAVLIAGALVLNELRRGLVEARIDSLTTQGELMASLIDQAATVGEPVPALEAARASEILQLLANPGVQRARLFDRQGQVIADSDWIANRVEEGILPPARPRGGPAPPATSGKPRASPGQTALRAEIAGALEGRRVAGVRRADPAGRVVSVSFPIRHVQAVLGVLTVEAGDVDSIIARQRAALVPFILLSIGVTLLSSALLTRLVALPVRRLARAADRVRLSRVRSISLPDLARRGDELGDLTRSLEAMTDAQSERMGAIERFAADVAHEIRNPLTSLRSAVETLDLVSDPDARARLQGVIQQDVQRMDRLVTDISNASRLDAELSREAPQTFDLGRLLDELAGAYGDARREGDPEVLLSRPEGETPVLGREGPLGQVFRNLIENARSFSPPGGSVRLFLTREAGITEVRIEDDGPGIPPENLETVFERFYTSRPRGSAFGGNSGLGLSIARQIVEAQGGTLRAENRVGEAGERTGACFRVHLPPRPAS
ncbi:MAG: ATP-binding protein [Phenylobacterium sp.]|jgi:two-component system sensor histidine kinase ChvG|uniref:ATP-binding protein n=1 Tax=Phenylobacterium sp. TaxID=1871053 RepID=UPI003016DE27